ncbi:MAG: ribonuclease H-like domain-containing protein [Polyangiaceae bacterium]|nr:ribonuclease H-like domain-containing protein [Polyangiaceae bacterium]
MSRPSLVTRLARIERIEQLAEARSETPATPAASAVAHAPELPFAVEQTPEGPLHVRTLRLSGAHQVGRAPVMPARSALSELLALLALDPALASCPLEGALYLDTETTGLGPAAGTIAFLVGLAFWDADSLVVEQLLVRQLGEEAPMLARVTDRIRSSSMLVTFNGKSFDMPVLRTRFVMAKLPLPSELPHLDLLHVARRVHKARSFGFRLGALERHVLGFVRENDVPSSEVGAYYLHFLRTGDARALTSVVEHNALDVVSMVALVGLYGESLEDTELGAIDLVGVARTLKRAGLIERAYEVASVASERGGGADAIRARGEIAKARGDKARAMADFESLAEQVDEPAIRLELAKLYEHHAKDAARALATALAGTGEVAPRWKRRTDRLRAKVAKVHHANQVQRSEALQTSFRCVEEVALQVASKERKKHAREL